MKFSLIKKTIIVIMCIAFVIATFAIAVYNKASYDMIISQYEHYSIDVTKLVAVNIDVARLTNVRSAILEIYNQSETKVLSDQWGTPEFEAYISQFAAIEEMDDYKAVHADLQKMQDQLDVDCLYIVWIDTKRECYIYLVDAAHEGACPPGCIDPFFLDDPSEFIQNLPSGMLPNISKTEEYGWLMATGMPIYNAQGEIVAMANVDISMNNAMAELVRLMTYIGLAFAGIALLFCVLAIILINRTIVKPIKKLSRAASQFATNKNAFSELHIARKDEIGILADSMVKMGEDINRYVSDLSSTREYADKMDHAANTDALTKACNKRAYDIKVKQLNKARQPYGIVLIDINGLKKINDTYGHDKGDISIKTVCKVVFRVFDRSTVYRVGGDEFVVVLENDDYTNRETLVQNLAEEFRVNAANESAEPWERATAAIGSAIFEMDTDVDVKSVVQRADAAMYQNKKAAKEAR